jgi:hypothetical protein
MNDMLGARARLDKLDLQQAAIAWHLYAEADARALNGVFDGSIDVGARFASALELHASRFPSVSDGLGVTERKILASLRKGALPFSEVFDQVSRQMRAFTWGDLQIRNLCWRLASGEGALLSLPEDIERSALTKSVLRLSPEGEVVLEGKRPATRGEAYWLGGCEISDSSPWRWDPATRRIVD